MENHKHINLELYNKKQTGFFNSSELINFINHCTILMVDKVIVSFELINKDEKTFKKTITLDGKIKFVVESDMEKSEFQYLLDEIKKIQESLVVGLNGLNTKIDTKICEVNTRIDNIELSLKQEILNSESRLKDYVDTKFDEHISKYHS